MSLETLEYILIWVCVGGFISILSVQLETAELIDVGPLSRAVIVILMMLLAPAVFVLAAIVHIIKFLSKS